MAVSMTAVIACSLFTVSSAVYGYGHEHVNGYGGNPSPYPSPKPYNPPSPYPAPKPYSPPSPPESPCTTYAPPPPPSPPPKHTCDTFHCPHGWEPKGYEYHGHMKSYGLPCPWSGCNKECCCQRIPEYPTTSKNNIGWIVGAAVGGAAAVAGAGLIIGGIAQKPCTTTTLPPYPTPYVTYAPSPTPYVTSSTAYATFAPTPPPVTYATYAPTYAPAPVYATVAPPTPSPYGTGERKYVVADAQKTVSRTSSGASAFLTASMVLCAIVSVTLFVVAVRKRRARITVIRDTLDREQASAIEAQADDEPLLSQ